MRQKTHLSDMILTGEQQRKHMLFSCFQQGYLVSCPLHVVSHLLLCVFLRPAAGGAAVWLPV
jgi:hypothetical protein